MSDTELPNESSDAVSLYKSLVAVVLTRKLGLRRSR